MALATGSRLGPFEILALLGAGGMGEVYRARDTSLKRQVAIKVLPTSFSRDPDRLHRFEVEAQATASLNHPNILCIFQVGQHEGAPYIVSELLEGETLRERLRRSPIRLREVMDIGIGVARGLAAAHERGITHRDLKPENLFLTRNGHVKILDFGLAKLLQSQSSATDTPTESIHYPTDAGHVLGTVGYMAPEQVRGLPADARSDIFAFGCVLYEMLSGNRAFQKPTSAETMSAILNEDPPEISESATAMPPGVPRLVHRCLEKAPERRFQSASDLAFALESLTDANTSSSAIVGPANSHTRSWIAPILILAALVFAWFLRQTLRTSRGETTPPAVELRTLTETGRANRAAATLDGRYVAYVKREAGKFELRLMQVATERDVQLLTASPLAIVSLHFSPDGNFIYFLRQLRSEDSEAFGVFRIATLGGPATPLATDGLANSVTVSPDGKQVAYISRTQNESLIVAVDPDGGNRHILARRPITRDFWFVEWSPSIDKLAAVAIGDEDMGLVRVELPSGSIHDLSVKGWGAVGQPAWNPDGATIFAPAISTGSSIFQIWAFDARSGAHHPVTASSTSFTEWSLSSTAVGDLIANSESAETTLWMVDKNAKSHSIPSIKGEGVEGVLWVGNQIVTGNISELIVHESDRQNTTKLRSYSSIYRQMARCGPTSVVYWAADSKRQSHIARTDIATGATSALTEGPIDAQPACTPDGTTLVFLRCTQRDNRCFLTRKSLKSGQSADLYAFDLTSENAAGLNPTTSVSADGKTVLFWKQPRAGDPKEFAATIPIEGGHPEMVKMPFPAGEASSFKFHPDSKSILLLRQDENGVGNIWTVRPDGRVLQQITHFDSQGIFGFDLSSSNQLVISRGSRLRDVVLIKNLK